MPTENLTFSLDLTGLNREAILAEAGAEIDAGRSRPAALAEQVRRRLVQSDGRASGFAGPGEVGEERRGLLGVRRHESRGYRNARLIG